MRYPRYAKMNVIVGFAICFVVTVVAGDRALPVGFGPMVKRGDEDRINKTVVCLGKGDIKGVILGENENGWLKVEWPGQTWAGWHLPEDRRYINQLLYYSVETSTQETLAVTTATPVTVEENEKPTPTVVKSDDRDKLNKEVIPGPDFGGNRHGDRVGIIEIDYEDGWVAVRWLDTRRQQDHSVGDDGVFELYYAEAEKGCTEERSCPIMGHMMPWSEWSDFSASCGMARRKRYRTCNSNTLPPARHCGEETYDMVQIHHRGDCPTHGRTTAKGQQCAGNSHCGLHRESYSWCRTDWYAGMWDYCCTTPCDNGKCRSGGRRVDCTLQEYCRDCHKNAHCISRRCVCKAGFRGDGKHCQRNERTASTTTRAGSAGATSTWSYKYVAQKAFDPNPSSYWHPKQYSSLPQTLFFKFHKKIQVTRFKVVGGGWANSPDHYPRNFTFFGSNAENCLDDEKWEYQKNIQEPEYTSNEFVTETSDNNHQYRCYGIKVEATRCLKNYTAIRMLQMFESATSLQRKSCRCLNGRQDEHEPQKTLNEMPSNTALPRECGTTATRRKRIVNGIAVQVLDHPWQVQLQRRESNRWKHLCGGTLIRDDTVLTAAHCLDSWRSGAYSITDFRIITGQQLVLEEDISEKDHTIQAIHIHEDYDESYANDIALVKIAQIGSGDVARPACLPNPLINDYSEKNPHLRLVVSGYGTTEFGQQYATELRATEVDTIATDQCQREFRNNSDNFHFANDVDPDSNMCGKDSNATIGGLAKSGCVGDSGGPIVTQKGGKSVLVGIVSWGQGCKDSTNHFPSVYTRVRCYLKWIHQKLGVRRYNECPAGRSNTSYTRRPGTGRSGASGSRGAGTGSSDSSDTQ